MYERFDVAELHMQFLCGQPFHHVVIDNFLERGLAEAAYEDILTHKNETWIHNNNINRQSSDTWAQSKKIAYTQVDNFAPNAKAVVDLFNSPECIQFIQDITGIQGLEKDPLLLGAGIHETRTHGRLAVHADFNIHPGLNKHRRVNALLYMNKDWKAEYNGELELWDAKVTHPCVKIAPIFNRLIIFRITDEAFHGHPNPWLGILPRLSYAFYYYTNDRPDHEKAPFHWADFRETVVLA